MLTREDKLHSRGEREASQERDNGATPLNAPVGDSLLHAVGSIRLVVATKRFCDE